MAGHITARVVGGLGNQLFIYAAGLRQAARLGCELRLDVRHYSNRTDFRFELGSFSHCATVEVPAHPRTARWERGRRRVMREPVFREASFAYDGRINAIAEGTRLEGYFQSWRYFEDVSDRLRQEILSPAGSTPWLDDWMERLNGMTPICIHVRRGDYTAPSTAAVHGLTAPAYFSRAVSHLRRLGHDDPILLFSDEPEAARRELDDLDDVVVVDREGSPYETMRLMAAGSALVLSNSSFSWWAAWVGAREGRTVIAPRPWFDDASLDTRDLLLPDWLTLERRSA